MGKSKLWTGIIVGASIGGLVSLFNKDTREYVKESSTKAMDKAQYYTTNPDIAVTQVKQTVSKVNQVVSSNSKSAMNVLDQIEGSVQKFLK